MTLTQQEEKLIEALAHLRDAPARLAWLIEQARQRPKMDPAERTDVQRVEGCLARLWLTAVEQDGRCQFRSDSDSLLVKAMAGLLCDFYSGHTPDEILAHPPVFLSRLGLSQHLTATRQHGLARAWERMRHFAEQCAHAPLRRS